LQVVRVSCRYEKRREPAVTPAALGVRQQQSQAAGDAVEIDIGITPSR
jgi:hypothetical protein